MTIPPAVIVSTTSGSIPTPMFYAFIDNREPRLFDFRKNPFERGYESRTQLCSFVL